MRRRDGRTHPAGPSHGVGAGAPSADRQAVAVTADGARAVSGDDGTVRGCGTWLPGKRSPAGPGPRRYRLYRLSASLSRLPWDSDTALPTYLSSVARST